jgi:hypothetical protein
MLNHWWGNAVGGVDTFNSLLKTRVLGDWWAVLFGGFFFFFTSWDYKLLACDFTFLKVDF